MGKQQASVADLGIFNGQGFAARARPVRPRDLLGDRLVENPPVHLWKARQYNRGTMQVCECWQQATWLVSAASHLPVPSSVQFSGDGAGAVSMVGREVEAWQCLRIRRMFQAHIPEPARMNVMDACVELGICDILWATSGRTSLGGWLPRAVSINSEAPCRDKDMPREERAWRRHRDGHQQEPAPRHQAGGRRLQDRTKIAL